MAVKELVDRTLAKLGGWRGLAGPALIVALVLVILHDVAFRGRMTDGNWDLLNYWAPQGCFLGDELRGGRIPYWNPYAFGGTPFASNPQSGWMFAPVMVLFGLLPCPMAIQGLVLALPLLAGLGSYAFLRAEKASRPAATVAGLSLAGMIAGSALTATVTFAGFMAWAPWMLAAASKAFAARSWSGRLVWSALAALSWGQVAGAHISNGLVMASVLIAMFVLYKGFSGWRSRRLSLGAAAGIVGVIAASLILANLALLLPRVFLLERSSIGLGYEGLRVLTAELKGLEAGPPRDTGLVTEPAWILRLGASPGAHLAAGALALSFAGLFLRRHRGTVLTLLLFGSVFYLLGLRAVAEALEPVVGDSFVGDFYEHAPSRFIFAEMLALGLLAGFGVEAWRAETTWMRRGAMLLPGIALWWAGPFVAGAIAARMTLLLIAGALSFLVLAVTTSRPAFLAFLPLLLSVELAANGLIGQGGGVRGEPRGAGRNYEVDVGLPHPRTATVNAIPEPTLDPRRVVAPTPNVRRAAPVEGRWLTVQGSGLMRFMFSEVELAQGFDPVQLIRYWKYWRSLPSRVDPSIRYTRVLEAPPASTFDLFQIGWMESYVADAAPPGSARSVRSPGAGPRLYRLDPPSKATAFYDWTQVGSDEAARKVVVARGFDPAETLVLEDDPGIAPALQRPSEDVGFEWRDTRSARIEADLSAPAVVLVRVPYDEMWRATIGGETLDTIPADYVMQAIPVPAGRQVIELSYRDPWVLRGLWGSAVYLLAIGAAALWSRPRRDRHAPALRGRRRRAL